MHLHTWIMHLVWILTISLERTQTMTFCKNEGKSFWWCTLRCWLLATSISCSIQKSKKKVAKQPSTTMWELWTFSTECARCNTLFKVLTNVEVHEIDDLASIVCSTICNNACSTCIERVTGRPVKLIPKQCLTLRITSALAHEIPWLYGFFPWCYDPPPL